MLLLLLLMMLLMIMMMMGSCVLAFQQRGTLSPTQHPEATENVRVWPIFTFNCKNQNKNTNTQAQTQTRTNPEANPNLDANSNSISIDDGRCQGHSRMEVMNPSERLFVLVFVVLCVCVLASQQRCTLSRIQNAKAAEKTRVWSICTFNCENQNKNTNNM